jgi:hypothetical protein
MAEVGKRSAEEFYSQCLANARTLEQAARAHAGAGDAVSALATAWGADVFTVQAVLWERILVVSPLPQRQFYRVADALFTGLDRSAAPTIDRPACRDVLRSARDSLLAECDPGLRQSIAEAWSDVTYLATVEAPTAQDIDAAVQARLNGMTPGAFVARRRQEAAIAMAHAQEERVRGNTVGAIQGAYESDFLGLEAYLVESAMAVGDLSLQSVVVRWELASSAVSQLAGLPDGFSAAVNRIRDTLGSGLAEADAARLRESLIPV